MLLLSRLKSRVSATRFYEEKHGVKIKISNVKFEDIGIFVTATIKNTLEEEKEKDGLYLFSDEYKKAELFVKKVVEYFESNFAVSILLDSLLFKKNEAKIKLALCEKKCQN